MTFSDTKILNIACMQKWAASWQTKKMTCAPSKDSDQSGHLPSLIREFDVCMKKPWVLSYPLNAQQSLWSDWADVQAELSLCWAHIILLVVSWGGSNNVTRDFRLGDLSNTCAGTDYLGSEIWAESRQNQQNGMCAQWRLRSAWASAQSDQSLRCAPNG